MKKLLLATSFALASWSAVAADLPTKAPFLPRDIPATGCGTYMTVGAAGGAGPVSNSPVPGASVVQGEIGAGFGYTCATGPTSLWFVEGTIWFANLNGAANGFSLSGPLDGMIRAGYGNAAIASFLGQFGFNNIAVPSLPILPVGVTTGTPVPYAALAGHFQDVSSQFIDPNTGNPFTTNRVWEVSPAFQIGAWSRLSNGVVADVYGEYQVRTTGACFGGGLSGVCPGLGNMYRGVVKFNF
jgi:hypothetical protein